MKERQISKVCTQNYISNKGAMDGYCCQLDRIQNHLGDGWIFGYTVADCLNYIN